MTFYPIISFVFERPNVYMIIFLYNFYCTMKHLNVYIAKMIIFFGIVQEKDETRNSSYFSMVTCQTFIK